MEPHKTVAQFQIRTAKPSDHAKIISVMVDWWGGRDLRQGVPKLFLVHFCNTSFIAEKDGEMAAFLVGFLSPAHHLEAYIHFVGVNPDYRKQGLGKTIYERFFELCRARGRTIIRACTSPVNKESVAFHTRMGFLIDTGDDIMDGVSVTRDYDGPGDHRVVFKKSLQ